MTAADAMVLTFLGTRGETRIRSSEHARHSALLVEYAQARVMIDCGADWLGRLDALAPNAIVLTHAHPDHAGGLAAGAPCPVYATKETWNLVRRFLISEPRVMALRIPISIDGVSVVALPVQHSLRAPAVCYRVTAQSCCFLYAPDVADLPHPLDVLRGVDLYIGDGATFRSLLLRRIGRVRVGHAPIDRQLGWCRAAGVRRAIFTHCGSAIVRSDASVLERTRRKLSDEFGVEFTFARDGDQVRLEAYGPHRRRRRRAGP